MYSLTQIATAPAPGGVEKKLPRDGMPEHILSRLIRAIRLVVIAIFAVMIGVTFLQVVCRYAFGAPLTWSEELCRYCFVWIVFLAAVIGLERGALLGVDIAIRR